MTTLVIGLLLAVTGLAFVLWPLLGGKGTVPPPGPPSAPDQDPEEERVLEALDEIEFDHATGKLSDDDHRQLRERYEAQLRALRAAREEQDEVDATAAAAMPAAPDDEVEAALAAYRSTHRQCPNCGIRPEGDARFCSNCGRELVG